MKRFAILAMLVVGCGSATAPTGTPTASVAIASPTPTATVTPRPTSTPTADPAIAINRHISAAVTNLLDTSDRSEIGDWFSAESDWLDVNAPIASHPELHDYVFAIVAGLSAAAFERDPTDAIAKVTAAADDLGVTYAGTPPTPDETRQLGETVTITNDGEDWASITINHVSTHAKYGSGYLLDKPARGHVYLQALVTYEALVEDVDYNPFDWKIYVDGVVDSDHATVYSGPSPELHSGNLKKGRKAKGYIVFEVPTRGEVRMAYGDDVFEVILRAK